ncbi:DUF3189 family protein [Clostridium sp. D2Q-11]|uniref:DUF3189 family protein n=1 Tax=Anaeromonas frigoriresistens TaxID=2683708 RepID=A0A942Z7J6_9FIRM|nr:DUF3189 family protein [Anaeromonas frigoriresistens]MBS4539631.1 DUF3189 family protein [Anaeromonas frigoriresistens]
MHIIYHCVGGTHSSAIAAAIHLGMLPNDKKPQLNELMDFPFFDKLKKDQQGRILLRGIDEKGNQVYTISRQFAPELVIPAIIDSYTIAGGNLDNLLLIDTMPAVNLLMKIGGFSSRRLHLVSFGRPIVAKGTLQAYEDLIKIVKDTKSKMI